MSIGRVVSCLTSCLWSKGPLQVRFLEERAANEEVNAELGEARALIRQLQARIAAMEALPGGAAIAEAVNAEAVRQENRALRTRLNEVERERDRLEETIRSLVRIHREDLRQLTEESHKRLALQREGLTRKWQEAEAARIELEAAALYAQDGWRRRFLDLERRAEGAEARVQSAEAELEIYKERKARAVDRFREAQRRIAALEERLRILGIENERLQRAVGSLVLREPPLFNRHQ